MIENDRVIVKDKNNQEKEYILLAILNYDNKHFIIYKDIDNKDNNKNLYASKIKNKEKDNFQLEDLNDSEWNIVEKEYSKLIEK